MDVSSLWHKHLYSIPPNSVAATVEFTIGRMHFTAYDIGGHQQGRTPSEPSVFGFNRAKTNLNHSTARPIWKEYFSEVDGIVFLVDATDSERFSEVKDKLDFLLSAEELAKMPFVVLGSKIDKPDAVSEEELVKQLGLFQTTGKGKVEFDGVRPLEVFMCSVMTRQGYDEGLRWLGGNL